MKKEKEPLSDKYEHLNLCNTDCATECTGLIHSLPLSKAEEESFNRVYSYRPPYVKSGKDKQKSE